MQQMILLAIQAIAALLPALSTIASPGISKVIAVLEQAIPAAVQLGEDLVTPIQNIIAALEGNGNITAEQIAQLQVQSAALDAALDAAAANDGLV
jgi:hypothetical protein